jgi:hypothetical protein
VLPMMEPFDIILHLSFMTESDCIPEFALDTVVSHNW